MTPTDMPQLEALFTRQRAAFSQEPVPTLAVRRDRLRRIGALLEQWRPKFLDAISRDFGGRSADETLLIEFAPLAGALRHTRAHLGRWMQPERRAASLEFLTMKNRVIHQPLGVVGIIAPWNYPLMLSFGPLIDVLAAGNRALLKPSEQLPETAALIAEAIAAHFDAGEVAVVNGGVDLAERFTRLPFDHLVFTGSTAVGRKVMAAAAENLTPVTLELGGKSPVILAPDYDLEAAARSLVFGKMMNAGQTCIAPDYVFVPRTKMEPLAKTIIACMAQHYPPESRRDFAALAGERHRARFGEMIAELEARGARLIQPPGPWADATHVTPTLVMDPPADTRVMQEEIFSPLLPLLPYDSLDEALAFINARPRPLALYLFTHDSAVRERVMATTRSGGVTLNGTIIHVAQTDLPFGGIGPSGLGAYHGRDGFRRFSHARAVAEMRLFDVSQLAMPPFGRLTKWLQYFMIR